MTITKKDIHPYKPTPISREDLDKLRKEELALRLDRILIQNQKRQRKWRKKQKEQK